MRRLTHVFCFAACLGIGTYFVWASDRPLYDKLLDRAERNRVKEVDQPLETFMERNAQSLQTLDNLRQELERISKDNQERAEKMRNGTWSRDDELKSRKNPLLEPLQSDYHYQSPMLDVPLNSSNPESFSIIEA